MIACTAIDAFGMHAAIGARVVLRKDVSLYPFRPVVLSAGGEAGVVEFIGIEAHDSDDEPGAWVRLDELLDGKRPLVFAPNGCFEVVENRSERADLLEGAVLADGSAVTVGDVVDASCYGNPHARVVGLADHGCVLCEIPYDALVEGVMDDNPIGGLVYSCDELRSL